MPGVKLMQCANSNKLILKIGLNFHKHLSDIYIQNVCIFITSKNCKDMLSIASDKIVTPVSCFC